MYSEKSCSTEFSYPLKVGLRALLLTMIGVITATAIAGCASQPAPEHQRMIHQMGPRVMPFDLTKTQHVFKMTDDGGIQQVIVRDQKDNDQLVLIREHLRHESMRFSMGDYSDPTSLHGTDMPGIKELEAGASNIKVAYSELANGAELVFVTTDIHIVTAIHRWFGAQLSDHGADATYR